MLDELAITIGRIFRDVSLLTSFQDFVVYSTYFRVVFPDENAGGVVKIYKFLLQLLVNEILPFICILVRKYRETYLYLRSIWDRIYVHAYVKYVFYYLCGTVS